jgi:hypothetical protein
MPQARAMRSHIAGRGTGSSMSEDIRMNRESARRGNRRTAGADGGVQEGAAAVAEQAGRTAEAQVSGMMSRAGDTLDDVSQAVRDAGEGLRSERPEIASAADAAAERVHEVSEYLRTHEAGDVLNAAQDFARRQPALVVGGGLLLGFALGRLLRASQPPTDEMGGRWQGSQGFDRSAMGYGGYGARVPGYGSGADRGYGAGGGYGAGQGGYGAGQGGYGAGQGGYGTGAGYGTAAGYGADAGHETDAGYAAGTRRSGTGYGTGQGGYGAYSGSAAAAAAGGASVAGAEAGMSRTELDDTAVSTGARRGEMSSYGGASDLTGTDLEASEDLGTTGGSEMPIDTETDETTRGA